MKSWIQENRMCLKECGKIPHSLNHQKFKENSVAKLVVLGQKLTALENFFNALEFERMSDSKNAKYKHVKKCSNCQGRIRKSHSRKKANNTRCLSANFGANLLHSSAQNTLGFTTDEIKFLSRLSETTEKCFNHRKEEKEKRNDLFHINERPNPESKWRINRSEGDIYSLTEAGIMFLNSDKIINVNKSKSLLNTHDHFESSGQTSKLNEQFHKRMEADGGETSCPFSDKPEDEFEYDFVSRACNLCAEKIVSRHARGSLSNKTELVFKTKNQRALEKFFQNHPVNCNNHGKTIESQDSMHLNYSSNKNKMHKYFYGLDLSNERPGMITKSKSNIGQFMKPARMNENKNVIYEELAKQNHDLKQIKKMWTKYHKQVEGLDVGMQKPNLNQMLEAYPVSNLCNSSEESNCLRFKPSTSSAIVGFSLLERKCKCKHNCPKFDKNDEFFPCYLSYSDENCKCRKKNNRMVKAKETREPGPVQSRKSISIKEYPKKGDCSCREPCVGIADTRKLPCLKKNSNVCSCKGRERAMKKKNIKCCDQVSDKIMTRKKPPRICMKRKPSFPSVKLKKRKTDKNKKGCKVDEEEEEDEFWTDFPVQRETLRKKDSEIMRKKELEKVPSPPPSFEPKVSFTPSKVEDFTRKEPESTSEPTETLVLEKKKSSIKDVTTEKSKSVTEIKKTSTPKKSPPRNVEEKLPPRNKYPTKKQAGASPSSSKKAKKRKKPNCTPSTCACKGDVCQRIYNCTSCKARRRNKISVLIRQCYRALCCNLFG